MLEYSLIFVERVFPSVSVNFEVWPEAMELGRLFAKHNYELALVGGPVRDMLLHRTSHDLDFALLPNQKNLSIFLGVGGTMAFGIWVENLARLELCVAEKTEQK